MSEWKTTKELNGNWKKGWALDQHMMQWPKRTEIAEMLYQLKYNNDKSKIEPLAEEIYKFMKTRYVTKYLSIIIPVPPSNVQRQFQPVLEVAKSIGKKLKIDVSNDCVLKTKTTDVMKNIPIEVRKKKLSGIFKVKNSLVKNKKVLLFDDIYETGSTLKEITKVLYSEGHVQNVYVVTITKTTTKSNSQ
jgi:predicted amidophosphoribosyltransferase|tara:strand:+ start:133 stop:699 length:567 start_codon:yes stop_codon:yes gene_type:complete